MPGWLEVVCWGLGLYAVVGITSGITHLVQGHAREGEALEGFMGMVFAWPMIWLFIATELLAEYGRQRRAQLQQRKAEEAQLLAVVESYLKEDVESVGSPKALPDRARQAGEAREA